MKLNDALKKLDKCLIQVEWYTQCFNTIERDKYYMKLHSFQRQDSDKALYEHKLKKANEQLKSQSELVIGLLTKLKNTL